MAAQLISDNVTSRNRAVVRDAFDAWAKGGDRFFDILADDATWTIAGSGISARSYAGKHQYVDEVMKPLQARLAGPVVPRLRKLWADADYVIVRWDQDATTHEGRPYRQQYAWFFKMSDSKVIEATAFLDLIVYNDLMTNAASSG